MKRKQFIFIMIVAILTSQIGVQAIFAGEGKSRVLKLVKAFKAYKKGNRSSVKAIEKILDLDFMAQRSMNLHWSKMSDSQKKKFMSIFKRLIEKLAYSKSGTYFKGNKYVVTGESTKTKRDYLLTRKKKKLTLTRVFLKVDYKTKTGVKKEDVVFVLLKRPGKGLIVFDIEILGGSLVRDYRNQFSRTIHKKGGVSGLIKVMEDKLAE
ncbi:MAG TPA: ABC transporter substrate-binding protein [Spirochaetes bacterium]|nr:ABC transporter substrate-binding protein [Spirochaetota bacterium]